MEAGVDRASPQLQPGTYLCGVTCTYSFLGLGAALVYGLVYHASLPGDEGLLVGDGGLLARVGERLLAPPVLPAPPAPNSSRRVGVTWQGEPLRIARNPLKSLWGDVRSAYGQALNWERAKKTMEMRRKADFRNRFYSLIDGSRRKIGQGGQDISNVLRTLASIGPKLTKNLSTQLMTVPDIVKAKEQDMLGAVSLLPGVLAQMGFAKEFAHLAKKDAARLNKVIPAVDKIREEGEHVSESMVEAVAALASMKLTKDLSKAVKGFPVTNAIELLERLRSLPTRIGVNEKNKEKIEEKILEDIFSTYMKG